MHQVAHRLSRIGATLEIRNRQLSPSVAFERHLLSASRLARHLQRRQLALGEGREPGRKLGGIGRAIAPGLAGRRNRPV